MDSNIKNLLDRAEEAKLMALVVIEEQKASWLQLAATLEDAIRDHPRSHCRVSLYYAQQETLL